MIELREQPPKTAILPPAKDIYCNGNRIGSVMPSPLVGGEFEWLVEFDFNFGGPKKHYVYGWGPTPEAATAKGIALAKEQAAMYVELAAELERDAGFIAAGMEAR